MHVGKFVACSIQYTFYGHGFQFVVKIEREDHFDPLVSNVTKTTLVFQELTTNFAILSNRICKEENQSHIFWPGGTE